MLGKRKVRHVEPISKPITRPRQPCKEKPARVFSPAVNPDPELRHQERLARIKSARNRIEELRDMRVEDDYQ